MSSSKGASVPSRRKLDELARAHHSLDAAKPAQTARGKRAGLGLLRRLLDRLPRRQPADIRAILAVPFFEHSGSLLMAHAASTAFTLLAAWLAPAPWRLGFLAANVALLALRAWQLRRASVLIGAGRRTAVLPLLPGYILAGCVWSALNGIFCGYVGMLGHNEVLRVLASTFATAVSAGIAARNAGAPVFASCQIAMWILPTIAGDFAQGGLHDVLGGAILVFVATMGSIVRRLHADMLKMILVERTSAALAARFDAALSNMSQGLILYDKDGMLRVINRRFFAIFGLPGACVSAGQQASDVVRACLSAGVLKVRGATPISLEAYARDAAVRGVLTLADGRFVAVSCEALQDGGSISTYEDITERRASEARIAHMAMHDALTGMPNRVLFRDRLDQAVARLSRGEAFGLACLDLDHFKAVNDTLGHNMGDKLLQAVAARLAGCVREVDLVARLGGDEFAILLPGLERAADAQTVARRLIETVKGAYHIDGATMTIGVSIGIALAPQDGSGADALLMHADLAMYAAKADGRGGVRLFERDLSVKLAARQALERELQDALEGGVLEVRYEPIQCTRTGSVTAFAAVACWQHPTRGLLQAEQFMPFAQERGLQGALGEWLLRTACVEAAGWPAHVCLSVKLSPAQARCAGLLAGIGPCLAESGLVPARLEIEIQEAALLDEADSVLNGLRAVRALGVRLAFDNFGAALSYLSTMDRIAFDKIRIGRAFVEKLDRSERAVAIVGAIVGLGNSLGLATAADGARSDAHMAVLRTLGCGEAQGYGFDAPRTKAEIAELLAET
jgi:diguanylate cyclase (GGDEF)-like protein